ncbi:MAG TPA: APC family permease [Phycisphaerae bacterium]|nr:APC family permease [Phycisphaerae bacterium]
MSILPDPVDPNNLPPEDSDDITMKRVRRWLIGKPRDLRDRRIFHHLSLIPFLAWVGLGADGLSSSAYGPEEAFHALGQNTYLAVALALATMFTVFIISGAYSKIIEQFPHGGGGYVVATKLLGDKIGVISGCALLIDYVLTITVSIAAAGATIFSMLPEELYGWKLSVEVAFIIVLTLLNIRGVKESVLVLTPIFIVFLLTHAILIGGGVLLHAGDIPEVASNVGSGFKQGLSAMGLSGMFLLFIHAYSLGGGTYTGIEAVSQALPIMREPRVQTAKRTMVYMAISLALTAGGLLLCYLLWDVHKVDFKTLNAVLAEKMAEGRPFGSTFVVITLLSEALLLVVAALAGFLGGPRVLSDMAIDSWVPRRFGSLSDRLTTQNGILLMGGASLAALLYTRGSVSALVVMYSINVFATFSISMFGMLLWWWRVRSKHPLRQKRLALFGTGFLLCATILVITVYEKFQHGGWMTIAVTGGFVILCIVIRRHYDKLTRGFMKLNEDLAVIERLAPAQPATPPVIDPSKPTAVVLVTSYSGLGIHTILHIQRAFSGYFKNLVFVSVGVIDSGAFKGADAVEALAKNVQEMLDKYVTLAGRLGFASVSRMSIGTEVVSEAEELCLQISREYSKCVFFTGQVIFARERWYQRLLHNQTAFAIQKRLQWDGMTMMILPVRVRSS